MFTIEDFRDAPMRVLGIADTANDVPAVVKALGLEGLSADPRVEAVRVGVGGTVVTWREGARP